MPVVRNDIEKLYQDNDRYIEITLKDLYFTGYTKRWLDSTVGYYYYTVMGDDCIMVLLNPDDSQQGLPTIDKIKIHGKILYNSHAMSKLLLYLSEGSGMVAERHYFHDLTLYDLTAGCHPILATTLFKLVYILSGLYAFISIIRYAIYIAFPVLSVPVQRLRCYGKPREILAEAEEELATLPQLATEDMFITEHYFIETSNYGVAIVPISQIIWIYKYSTLHKFLWHHFSISYTLHITAAKRQYIHCPKNNQV